MKRSAPNEHLKTVLVNSFHHFYHFKCIPVRLACVAVVEHGNGLSGGIGYIFYVRHKNEKRITIETQRHGEYWKNSL